MNKSSRHSKITGDFAERLFLYWLPKYGYECAHIDHVGIDLIGRKPQSAELMGISVKCRSRYSGTEAESVNLPSDGFEKARAACRAFMCRPYYAIVVDGADTIWGFLLPLEHLEKVAGGSDDGMRYWQMTAVSLERYAADPMIERFELQTSMCTWRNRARPQHPDQLTSTSSRVG
jgi:hypothetical protein